MTNKEKAREIGKVNARQYRHNYGGNEFVFSNEECEASALQMAEWKDQQFKEYLEKKRNSINLNYHNGAIEANAYVWDAINEIINELFKAE